MIKKILFILLLGLSFVNVKAYTYTEWSTEYPEGVKDILIEEEVRHKWYKEIETNIEYLDSDSFEDKEYDLTDYILSNISDESIEKPEAKENRIIYSNMRSHTFSAYDINHIMFKNIINREGLYFSEIEIIDKKSGNNIDYSFVFDEDILSNLNDNNRDNYIELSEFENIVIYLEKSYFVDDLEVNIYYKTDKTNTNFLFMFKHGVDHSLFSKSTTMSRCDDGCVFNIYRSNLFSKTLTQRIYFYTYQDTLFKTYNIRKEYVEGYFKELDGYIKDEDSETTFYRYIDNCYIFLDAYGKLVPDDDLAFCDKNFCYFIFVKKKRMFLL